MKDFIISLAMGIFMALLLAGMYVVDYIWLGCSLQATLIGISVLVVVLFTLLFWKYRRVNIVPLSLFMVYDLLEGLGKHLDKEYEEILDQIGGFKYKEDLTKEESFMKEEEQRLRANIKGIIAVLRDTENPLLNTDEHSRDLLYAQAGAMKIYHRFLFARMLHLRIMKPTAKTQCADKDSNDSSTVSQNKPRS